MRSAVLCASIAERIFIISEHRSVCGRSGAPFSREGYPLSHLATLDASSPKGTPWSYVGNFAATTKSRPLGEGGCDQREQAEGVSEQQRSPLCFFLPSPVRMVW